MLIISTSVRSYIHSLQDNKLIVTETYVHCMYIAICDRASEKGPSGHIKFDHLFQLCCIITKDTIKEWHDVSTINELKNESILIAIKGVKE